MKHKKTYLFVICFWAFLSTMAITCYANPDTKPFVIVLVNNAPSDMEITFDDGFDYTGKGRKYKIGNETQFALYSAWLREEPGFKITVVTNEQTTEYILDTPLFYRNIFTLNSETGELTDGKTPLRYIRMVMIYVLLTLLLEGFVFYLFVFRKKTSWVAFVIINLISQGILHILTDSPNLFDKAMQSAMIFGIDELIITLILGEIFVFLFEIIAFTAIVRERGIANRIIYVLVANSFSLILGWFMFPFIPI